MITIFKVLRITPAALEPKFDRLEDLLWSNFSSLKKSLILIPKLSYLTFLKGDIRQNLEMSLFHVNSLLTKRQKRYHLFEKKTDKKHVPIQQRAQSFLDMFVNYFTENPDDIEDLEKESWFELEALKEIKDELFPDQEFEISDDDPANISETGANKMGDENVRETYEHEVQKYFKNSSQQKIIELFSVMSGYLRENLG